MSVYDIRDEGSRDEAVEAATAAVRAGELVVLPTDTVYGLGADAFNHDAVQALLDAKGRGREYPPPVLIADQNVLHALGVDIPAVVEDLADAFWPGALTVIVRAQPSLMWDLGESRGTVALRMPDDEAALALLKRTGPLAVSSANKHGRDASTSVTAAAAQLGESVSIYLDGGRSAGGESSTIIDATVEPPEILRHGAIAKDTIIEKLGDIFASPEPVGPDTDDAEPAAAEPSDAEAADQLSPAADPAEQPGDDAQPTAPDSGDRADT
ncbi:L-threonylcarbamoyladenylate synthase [Helcobacillus massiliensis]|uniref:L-threonylcarbamoyladenylate synthase n=1 Tax=Helcobacillus massiliensis TaxID=521392 RepID=UPI0021A36E44|nr:L-threonylcarbamoyladenylate synthase [Helcobacillus massiliensis]MCT1557359.1 L-threonylcarbamoyladenylate synthase [Helcobacillus massiliensis]MCT2037097.1 L-threonylcarbamoyladenylate synthase [Helcobacillus massiliensis]MCT2331644.1 L-threonylcarbamoyladenylate synthase [Helcobacillus massiliensis]MDK7742068.1 L-threonylcarbamoyladenylate synthase [Helcobacillus massiliensis]WOO93623.1 L-threonylcarbamoyladenylate synthase [Helcobacillus massiliensis]